jgi:pimeloyl-ACP methyl ester carboxylesterase
MKEARIGSYIELQADKRPEAPAFYLSAQEFLSYGKLAAQIDAFAAELSALGCDRRHRLAIVLPHGAEAALVFYAVAKVAAAVPLNPACSAFELTRYLEIAGVDAVITTTTCPGALTEAAANLHIPLLTLCGSVPAGLAIESAYEPLTAARKNQGPEKEDADILFTSGTTGAAQGGAPYQCQCIADCCNDRSALSVRRERQRHQRHASISYLRHRGSAAFGGDSLMAEMLFAEIEKAFGLKLPASLILANRTFAALAELIRNEGRSRAEFEFLLPIKEGGSLPPLFCIHIVGGYVLTYRKLADYLGKNRPVYGLALNIASAKLRHPLHFADLASLYIEEMRLVQPRGPYHVAGHSLGGLLASEVCRQLLRQGQEVGFLGLFDTLLIKSKIRKPPWFKLLHNLKKVAAVPFSDILHYLREKTAGEIARHKVRRFMKKYPAAPDPDSTSPRAKEACSDMRCGSIGWNRIQAASPILTRKGRSLPQPKSLSRPGPGLRRGFASLTSTPTILRSCRNRMLPSSRKGWRKN